METTHKATGERYAVYFSPSENTPLYRFGEMVLGRSAFDPAQRYDETGGCPVPLPLPALMSEITAAAAFYGFHATLKAPFALADDNSAEALLRAVDNFSRRTPYVPLHGLAPRRYRGFTALCFDNQPVALKRLASACVLEFEPFRKPLSSAEFQARIAKSQLNTLEKAMLEAYGYPYVHDCFDFHMTLSGRLGDKPPEAEFFHAVVALYNELLAEPPLLDQLSVWHQPDRASPFVQLSAFQLSG
jgi:hypothetical protein